MKNLKNWIAFLLVIVFAMSLAACSTKEIDSKGNTPGNTQSEDQSAFSNADDAIYGKITAITGNEIEIAVAKKPTEDDNGADELQGNVITPNENDTPIIGEEIDDPIDNLELTGETKSFTLPAGVKISNMGQEMNLSGLKKGDIISILVDPEDSDIVLSVEKVK